MGKREAIGRMIFDWDKYPITAKSRLIEYGEALHGKPIKREKFLDLFYWTCENELAICDLPEIWIKKIEKQYGDRMQLNFIGEKICLN